jgi:hypothetical protein
MESEIKKIINSILCSCINLSVFYPFRTVMKYQYFNGGNFKDTMSILIKDCDKLRLYRGFSYNSSRVILNKTVDMYNYSNKKNYIEIGLISTLTKTILLPLDTIGNVYQTKGKNNNIIKLNNKKYGKISYYNGFSCFFFINMIYKSSFFYLLDKLKNDKNTSLNNMINGIISSSLSDILVNPLRVIKSKKQNNYMNISYYDIIKKIRYKELIKRGLLNRIFINSLSNGFFIMIWKESDKII